MTRRSLRLGLSFEVAPPQAADPMRTDIACFVGNVARRRVRVVTEAQPLPPVLLRWLQSLRVHSLGGVPLERQRVRLASVSQFVEGLQALASNSAVDGLPSERVALHSLFGERLDADARDTLAELLRACRELTPVPASVLDDLRERGFEPGQLLGPDRLAGWLRLQRLHNLPVVVESFEAFDALFAWDERGVRDRVVRPGDPVVATPLGAAVRAFFGEGGRRAYVVRSGDPSDVFDTSAGRFAACFPERQLPPEDDNLFDQQADRCPQLPGLRRVVRRGLLASVTDLGTPPGLSGDQWQGLEHVYGLADVSFVALPDLIDACAQPVPAQVPPAEVVAAPEVFVECVDEDPEVERPAGRRLPAPRLNALGLQVWATLLRRALAVLHNPGRAVHRRDPQLLASLPLVGEGRDLPAPTEWLAWMSRQGWLDELGAQALCSDRLQLAYPWVVSRDSADCQGGVEAPEGSLAGVLARNALERGAYRSAANQALRRWQASEPRLAWTQALQQLSWTPLGEMTLAERVCLLGPAPRGPRLLSDVSCSAEAATRQASVRRLVNVVIQAARRAGDEFAFEPSGEPLWARVRERLSDLMRVLLAAGALSTDGVPFSVRCGRDTMRQNDLDAGRLIAEIELLPAQPIQRIVVVLNLRDAGPSAGVAAPRRLAVA
jgi:hypothetical protein